MRNYRIGVDGGGTKTRVVLLDENLQIIGEGVSGSSNLYAVGLEKAAQNILEAADFALAQSRISRAEVLGWGLGLGGVCSETESARIEAALRGFLGETVKIVAREDVVAAHRGAFDWPRARGPQIVCIAGTGANCFGRNPNGETAKSDGLGPLLGDRGSGYRIGEAALRFYGNCADGIAPHTDFSHSISAHFGAKNLNALIEIVYAPDFERSRVASLVPLVLQFSEADLNARKILEDAGRELAQTARAVLGKLATKNEGNVKAEIALVGGVLSGAALVRQAFQKSLGAAAELVEARYESAIGAALLL
ncbi:BadF-type ATPase [Abditibacterium utsteinense]|uniref:BadF-type ATPase n=1 Tax=Abditibacterium utsteinense TaxID=1960156 RepID=A0A2S8SX29_9BACT|nr:BadF/BadG/BcrA/BcrD ATPase family protein [Abditibacterium utsteinense]PQV65362.1 BadF-type ATPase [Abditibacterium utsteinense]